MSRPPTNEDSSHYPSAMNFQDLMDLSNSVPEECASALPNTNAQRTLASANRAPPQQNHLASDKINYEDSMLTKMEAMLESNALADVTLLVGEERAAIHAHKLILALASPVFTAMFYGEFANQRNNTTTDPTLELPSTIPGTSQQLRSPPPPGGIRHNILSSPTPPELLEPLIPPPSSSPWQAGTVVEITDCTPDAIKSFLHFIYNNGIMTGHHNSLSVDDALSLLYTARKYNVRALEDKCIVTLSSSITADNVFDILYAATFYNLNSLDYLCWQFMEDNPIDVLNTHLDYLTHDTLQSILKNDKLNCNEVDLFQGLMRWAEQECTKANIECSPENIRRLCAAELKMIRFPIMSGPEFADIVVPTGVLAVEQVAKIFTVINTSADRKKAQDMEDSSRSSVLLNGMEFCTRRRTPNNKKPIQQQNAKGHPQGTNSSGQDQEETNLMNRPPPVFTFIAEQQIRNGEEEQSQQQLPVGNNVAAQPMQMIPAPPPPVIMPGNNENIVGMIDYGIPGVVGIVPLNVAPAAPVPQAGAGERGRSRQRQSRRNRRRSGSGGNGNGSNEGQNGQ